MIVEIDLGVLKFELEECSIDKLDQALDVAIKRRQRAVFKEYMEREDARLVKENRTCPKCGQAMSINSRQTRRMGILAGPVTIYRRRLRCRVCGLERYPLDEKWTRSRRHTLPVIERALYLATDTSYEKAAAALKKLTGAEMSHGQIQMLAKEEGAQAGRELDKQAHDLFGLGLDPGEIIKRGKDDTIIIAVDGGMIPDRATKDDFEAKVGVIYGIKAQVSKGRMALVDRVAYASLEDGFRFGQKLFCLARRHGVLSAGRALLIGDGAAWIRHLAADFFPQAVYLLDLFHLKRRINQVLNTDQDEALACAIVEACQKGEPRRALSLLHGYHAQTPEHAEELRKLQGYIYTNREGIANYARSDLFGSGAVEKAVDILISRRFKMRGMSWLKGGAKGMLALRLLRFNGQWDAYWKQRMEQIQTCVA